MGNRIILPFKHNSIKVRLELSMDAIWTMHKLRINKVYNLYT